MTVRGKGKAIDWVRSHVSYAGDECLVWPFSRTRGYGTFGYLGKSRYATRFMCELAHGPAPSRKHEAAHSCGNGAGGCVNPRHLSWKTRAGNMRDKVLHGNQQRRQDKLTRAQVDEIKSLHGKRKVAELASAFRVSESTISKIMNGHTWKPDSHRGWKPGDPRNPSIRKMMQRLQQN